jgi:hypothetical protein
VIECRIPLIGITRPPKPIPVEVRASLLLIIDSVVIPVVVEGGVALVGVFGAPTPIAVEI